MFEVDKNFKKANTPCTIRFTQTLFDSLHEVATEEGISFNLLVLQCCQYALDNRGKKGAKRKTKARIATKEGDEASK